MLINYVMTQSTAHIGGADIKWKNLLGLHYSVRKARRLGISTSGVV